MKIGLKKGDRVVATENNAWVPVGTRGTIVDIKDYGADVETDTFTNGHDCDGAAKEGYGWFIKYEYLEKESMAEKRKVSGGRERNPKNFRNGDVIKVTTRTDQDSMVFVKFGENYYNLTAGGQMKACRYLPPGTKEIITNLSGMGKFFLMSEEELEEQAGRPSGGNTPGTEGMLGLSTVTDFEHIMKIADSYNYTDTTEEK